MIQRILLVVTFAAGSASAGNIELTGRRELAEAIVAVQQANASRYPSGRLKGTCRHLIPERHYESRVEIIWDGEKRRWNYEYRQANDTGFSRWKPGRRIVGPSARGTYLPGENRLILRTGTKTSTIPDYLKLLPDELWYTFERIRPWTEMLAPDFGEGYVDGVQVDLVDEHLVKFVRHYKTGNVLSIDCDMNVGGNIVGYHVVPGSRTAGRNANHLERKGSYQWVPDGSGGFRAHSIMNSEFPVGQEDHPVVLLEVTIEEFDPNYKAPKELFTLKGLDVPRGARVDEYSPAHRSYFFGGKPSEAERQQRELDRLINEAGEDGFSDPKRSTEK